MKRTGALLLVVIAVAAAAAPWLAPNAPDARFADLLYAPPTRVRLGSAAAPLQATRWRLADRLTRRYVEDARVPVRWFRNGRLLSTDRADTRDAPLLLLGADAYGRDVFARVLYGARVSLPLALIATVGAIALGALLGAIAGATGGWLDEAVSRLSDFVLVLPVIYVCLALRAVLPLVLAPATVFVLLAGIFALAGWPVVARGVRAVIATEREREYVLAARALGAPRWRVIVHHLLPAARGYLSTQALLLLPAFVLAEATLSFVGLGFPDTVPTWGTMLHDAGSASVIADAPWMLAPAAAMFIVVLGVNLVVQSGGRGPLQLER